jgi:hypothetical protein
MDRKKVHIVQSSMSIVKTEDTCPEYPQNLLRTSMKICPEHPQNLSGTSLKSAWNVLGKTSESPSPRQFGNVS